MQHVVDNVILRDPPRFLTQSPLLVRHHMLYCSKACGCLILLLSSSAPLGCTGTAVAGS